MLFNDSIGINVSENTIRIFNKDLKSLLFYNK